MFKTFGNALTHGGPLLVGVVEPTFQRLILQEFEVDGEAARVRVGGGSYPEDIVVFRSIRFDVCEYWIAAPVFVD